MPALAPSQARYLKHQDAKNAKTTKAPRHAVASDPSSEPLAVLAVDDGADAPDRPPGSRDLCVIQRDSPESAGAGEAAEP